MPPSCAVARDTTMPPSGLNLSHVCATQAPARPSHKMIEIAMCIRTLSSFLKLFDPTPKKIRALQSSLRRARGSSLIVRSRHEVTKTRSEPAVLVGCAFRYQDSLDPAVRLLAALLRRGRAGTGTDARGINSLLAEVLPRKICAGLRQFRGLRFLRIREANDHQLGIGFILQAQCHVIEDALAFVVHALGTGRPVTAFSNLRRLWRRGWLLHVHIRGGAGAAALTVVGRARDGVAARGQAGGVKLRRWSGAGDLTGRSGVAVSNRVAIRIASLRINRYALTGGNWVAFRRAGYDRRTVWLLRHCDIDRTCRGPA